MSTSLSAPRAVLALIRRSVDNANATRRLDHPQMLVDLFRDVLQCRSDGRADDDGVVLERGDSSVRECFHRCEEAVARPLCQSRGLSPLLRFCHGGPVLGSLVDIGIGWGRRNNAKCLPRLPISYNFKYNESANAPRHQVPIDEHWADPASTLR